MANVRNFVNFQGDWVNTDVYAAKPVSAPTFDGVIVVSCPVVSYTDGKNYIYESSTPSTAGVTPPTNGSGWIEFSAAASNTGDSGTFEPTLTCVTPGDLNIVYGNQDGYYVVEGDMVHINVTIVTTTFTYTTAAGAISITGLPYPAAAGAGNSTNCSLSFQGITKAGYTQFTPQISPGSTVIYLSASGSGQTNQGVVIDDLPTGGSVLLQISGTYVKA